jgi:hypothetical protein
MGKVLRSIFAVLRVERPCVRDAPDASLNQLWRSFNLVRTGNTACRSAG